MSAQRVRIALLIDADNASADKVGAILADLAEDGECSIRRAYGNWTKPNLKSWIEQLHDAAIRPMQQFDLTAHKNASDMALAIDAVELLHSAEPDAFAIVSSDSDFTPLVQYLREKGCDVYGYGRARTPMPFQSACNRFTIVEQLVGPGEDADDETEEAVPSRTVRKTSSELKADIKLVNLLRSAIRSAADDEGWATVSQVGNVIRNQSSLDWRNYGYAKLSALLKAVGLFEVRNEGKSNMAVRIPRRAPAKKTPAKKTPAKP